MKLNNKILVTGQWQIWKGFEKIKLQKFYFPTKKQLDNKYKIYKEIYY